MFKTVLFFGPKLGLELSYKAYRVEVKSNYFRSDRLLLSLTTDESGRMIKTRSHLSHNLLTVYILKARAIVYYTYMQFCSGLY